MHLQPGGRLGPYEVSGVLGKGGMGVVYRGIDTRLNRPVAIKTSEESFSERFNNEARAISSLNHPNVCTLYDVGPDYLVMELLEGDTLAARLEKGALPLAEVSRYGMQIASALAAAHSKGIIHRDLKPGNIILTSTGVKVLDFGIAKITGPSVETATATRGIIGTVDYMSPEQLAGRAVDSRSDIYALGLVLFEMATGTRVKAAANPAAALSTIPERLAHVIERCLEQDPEERWQSAIDVRRELEWAAHVPAVARTATSRGRYLPLIVVTAIALEALGMAGVRLLAPMWERTPAPPPQSRTTIALPAGLRLDSSAPLAVSPDGTMIAFAGINQDGVRALYLRPLASDSSTELKGTTGASHPFFSPDGQSIGFFANESLHRIGVGDTAPVRICPLPGVDHGGGWGADDTIVVAIRGRGLFKVKATGGSLERIATDLFGAWPSFLPDGATVLYLKFNETGKTVGIAIASLDGSVRRDVARLSDEAGNGAPILGAAAEIQQALVLPQGYLVFGQDPGFVRALPLDTKTLSVRGSAVTLGEQIERGAGSGGIAFAAAATGLIVFGPTGNDHQLVWVTRQGVVSPINVERGAYREPALSPDGRTIAVSMNDETRRPDLWIIDVARETRTRIRTDVLAPEWMPDGRRIAINNDPLSLALISPDGRVETLATQEEARKHIVAGSAPYPTGWSPDGRYLLFQAGASDMWRLKYPEKIFEPVLLGPSNDFDGKVSSDGKRFAFVSNASGRSEIYVARWPGLEQRTPVSTHGGNFPKWSRDGSELFYWQNRTLMAARISPELQVEIPKPLFTGDFVGAARDASYDVTADRRFLMVKSDERAQLTRIAVLQNWMR